MKETAFFVGIVNHTSQQMAAHNMWETPWPVNTALSLFLPLFHLSAGTTLCSRTFFSTACKCGLVLIACLRKKAKVFSNKLNTNHKPIQIFRWKPLVVFLHRLPSLFIFDTFYDFCILCQLLLPLH
jgi:hypothetical protein